MSSMSVATLTKIAPLLPSHHSVLIRGKHGIGKSQVVRYIGWLVAQNYVQAGHIKSIDELECIDRRLSQVSEGDIVGLPSTDGEVTRFNPPDWYKRACRKPCILFLDELNRSTPEVMQAAFQIVLDYELNGWKLHELTRVFVAVNNSSEYNVNEIDPALLDRFWVVDLHPTTKDWITWARRPKAEHGGGIHPLLVDFIAQNDKWLDPEKNISDLTKKSTSRRSWERLNMGLVNAGIMEQPTHDLFYPICLGYVGLEATAAFQDFAKNYSFQVSAEDILNNYPNVKSKIGNLGQERMNICIDKVSDYVLKEVDKLSDKQGENLKSFMKDLDGELRISLWSKLTQQGIDKLELAKSIHKHCAELVLDVFGVPMGEAGIGVVPNIPGIFKAPAQKGATPKR